MMKLNFVPMDEAGYHILSSWFVDPILHRWYSPPTPAWLAYVQKDPGVYAWMVYDNDLPVGHIQVDIEEDGTGYLGFVVNPELRRQGYGKQMLTELLHRPEMEQVTRVVGDVESGNSAGAGCLQSVGFIHDPSSPAEEGFLRFIFIRRSNP